MDKLIDLLREHILSAKPVKYVFEGEMRGKMYSATSIQHVLKQSVLKAGIRKPVRLHWLRHFIRLIYWKLLKTYGLIK